MTRSVWRVVVAREIDEAAGKALAREGARYVSAGVPRVLQGHSGPGLTSSSILVHAETEDEARERIERALGPHSFIREARRMPVFVHARIEPAARSAFEAAAAEDERVGGVTEEEATGAIEVYFELPGEVWIGHSTKPAVFIAGSLSPRASRFRPASR